MASRFWVGGTGTWNNASTAFWAATSGGAGGQSVPGASDTVTFDGSSGGGTVTVDSPNGAGVVTVQSITMGAFTGTLDFATNNNNVTLTASPGLSCSGTGTRTLNMGSGTWTITVNSGGTSFTFGTTTGLTLSAASASIVLAGTGGRAINGGGQTFGSISFGADTTGSTVVNGGGTFSSVSITAPCYFQFAGNYTISSAPTWTGTASNRIFLENVASTAATVTAFTISSGAPALDYTILKNVSFTGSGTATNSISLGNVSGITVTAPSTGSSGARIIGG
jgi:hypothetical protein